MFLTSRSPHHFFVINEVHKVFPIKKVFFQTRHIHQRKKSVILKGLFSSRQRRFVIRRILVKMIFGRDVKRQTAYETERFFKGQPARLEPDIPFGEVESFNSERGVEAVREVSPDLVIVFGTEILKGEILKVAKINTLNIHRDILPKYRGGGLPYWVFYNGDFEYLGTTIHVCAPKLDAGDIVGQKFYALKPKDKIYMLRYQTTVLTAELLKEVIADYKSGTIQYQKQEKTKLWTEKNMTLFKQIRARWNFWRHVSRL